MENSLPSSSTSSSNPSGGVCGGGTEEAPQASNEEEKAVRGSFKFSSFASLAHRVAGDDQSLQTLERLKVRWHARYGDSSSGTLSTTIGALSGSELFESHTVACGSSPRTRVTETINPLPPARVLLQDATGLPSPRPVSPNLPSTEATESFSPDHADVYV
ncbi:hypothetical protein Salat_2492500, partial [Sesamum alatum]